MKRAVDAALYINQLFISKRKCAPSTFTQSFEHLVGTFSTFVIMASAVRVQVECSFHLTSASYQECGIRLGINVGQPRIQKLAVVQRLLLLTVLLLKTQLSL